MGQIRARLGSDNGGNYLKMINKLILVMLQSIDTSSQIVHEVIACFSCVFYCLIVSRDKCTKGA